MTVGQANPFPLQVVVNYWEKPAPLVGKWLDELLNRGVRYMTAFVPWHCFETDLTHSLRRFVQAAAERQIEVTLVPSLEVGVHYPHSGLPREWVTKRESGAISSKSSPIFSWQPPNAFLTPSLHQTELTKRFFQHLTKVDMLLADLGKNDSRVTKFVRLATSSSFFKYYRAPEASMFSPFEGLAGDFSEHASAAYRTHLEQYYSQREFQAMGQKSLERFRSRASDERNRRVFNQSSEDVFRNRQAQSMGKRPTSVEQFSIEVFTPEFDPAFQFTGILSQVMNTSTGFDRFSFMIDEFATRQSSFEGRANYAFMHLTELGAFSTFVDAERQFLAMKSLVLSGSHGALLIDEAEWFRFSEGFRRKLDTLASRMRSGRVRLPTRVFFLTSDLWSNLGALWSETAARVFPWVKAVTSLDPVLGDAASAMVVVDPQMMLTREIVARLISLARIGKIVAIPKSPNFTDAARRELEAQLSALSPIDMEFGFRYQIYPMNEGRLVCFDAPDVSASASRELSASYKTFLAGLSSLAGVKPPCRVLKGNGVAVIPFDFGKNKALFLMNPTEQSIEVELGFSREFRFQDLYQSLEERAGLPAVSCQQITLDVPARGILPIAVGLEETATDQATQPSMSVSQMTFWESSQWK